MICGTMTPTQGGVETNGRISALLELGSGFNPEFTGKDNVYLNGAIMGLSRETMDERFEDIVSFADIGDFIGQPVKTYSSGMYVRLAFACAINVIPDILIVDEALAVGDAKFQRKCFRKFSELQEEGKTILLVTHAEQLIIKLCNKAILLDNGKKVSEGEPKKIIHQYLELISDNVHLKTKNSEKKQTDESRSSEMGATTSPSEKEGVTELDLFLRENQEDDRCSLRKNYNTNEYRHGDKRAEIIDFLLVSEGRYEPQTVTTGDWVDIYIKILFHENVETPFYGFKIRTIDGVDVMGAHTLINGQTKPAGKSDTIVYKFSIKVSLQKGDYFINIGIMEKKSKHDDIVIDRRADLIHITVIQEHHFSGIAMLDYSFIECPC
ncbi:MAG: Wzt carbohydrate-binding domain-containing protein [Candidatus Scalindua sp.]|nr:Wzt carbohydrate-binding domain-containing protein [Candidatus Scalindua sp.]